MQPIFLTVIVAENCFSQIFAWCDQSWNRLNSVSVPIRTPPHTARFLKRFFKQPLNRPFESTVNSTMVAILAPFLGIRSKCGTGAGLMQYRWIIRVERAIQKRFSLSARLHQTMRPRSRAAERLTTVHQGSKPSIYFGSGWLAHSYLPPEIRNKSSKYPAYTMRCGDLMYCISTDPFINDNVMMGPTPVLN